MNIIQCSPAIRPRDFSALPRLDYVESDEDAFFSAIEEGTPYRFKTPYPTATSDLREKLFQLSKQIGCDFVVYGQVDQWGGGDESVVVVRLAGMAHGGRIRKDVADSITAAPYGEEVAYTRQSCNQDVFFHIITGLEEAADATGDAILWRLSDDDALLYVLAQRVRNDDDKRSILERRAEMRFSKTIRPRSKREADYHSVGVGESCRIAFDGSKGRALNIRSIVSAYGRRAGRKFKVKQEDACMIVTRTQ